MEKIDLRGKWTLVRVTNGDTCPALVPGDTHSALLAAGRIPDPYDQMNELDVQWVGREDWTYRRTVTVPARFLAQAHVFLHADVLDTVATVVVNGRPAGRADNMFARARFDVKALLRPGTNEIEIRFQSAEAEAARRSKLLPYPVPTSSAPVASPHRNLVRKVPCHAGWDWGPCLMVAGIYGEIYLAATATGVLEYVHTLQRHEAGQCRVWVTAEVTAVTDCRTTFEVQLGDQYIAHSVTLHTGRNTVTAEVRIPQPKLWWPNGHGTPHLYDLCVKIAGNECRKRLGLRTLELVTEEDQRGLSFWFRVNGRPIFCKGADWIPCDALPQRQTRAVYDDLLGSAVAAHMNMLRVWGGGQYEPDCFYDLCDEKGILVWQDFMFACSLYPAEKWFLESVRREAEHQVKRLRDHACLALWCGDNENVGAINWYEESRKSRDRYVIDYHRLNEGVLGAAVDQFDPTRRFWPSSPCGGRGNFGDCWHDDRRGDMHYWSVWHEGKSFDAYLSVKPRFCSEFGYQSFPSLTTVRQYARPADLNVTSPVMEHHQRHSGGNARIVEMFSRYFRLPEGFANFVYLSQVQQALAIKTGVEFWRHLRPLCMGTLYWQLNDNWPVCSWASLEYGGKWKLLHYAAKRFYAPVLVSTVPDGEHLEVWVTNDRPQAVAAKVTVRVLDFRGRVLKREVLPAKVGAGQARRLKRYVTADLAPQPERVFLHLSLRYDRVELQNEHFFAAWKRCELAQPQLAWAAKPAARGGLAVTLKAKAPAFFVSLEAAGLRGEFDDNCVTVLPGAARTLVFRPKAPVTLAKFKAALAVRHLRGTYA